MRRIPALLAILALIAVFAGPVAAGGTPIEVQMTGAAERPGPGDADGVGTARFTLNQGQGEICYWLTVSNITLPATAAHIHIAPPTAPGPVIIPLAAPDATGTSSGCVSVDKALVKAIRQNPEAYYVNVHNADFGPGAVRAQLG